MRRLTIYAAIIGIGLGLFGSRIPALAQTGGQTAAYSAGLNLVSGPPGTDFTAAQGVLSTYQSGDRSYESVPAASGTSVGYGYWAQFGGQSKVQLTEGSDAPYSARVLAGQWVLIGDPSGTHPAKVTGADAIYTYDPVAGYQAATELQPGQGAWARSGGGGTITVTPQTPEMLAAAASLRPFAANGYQIGIPAGWERIVVARDQKVAEAKWGAADGKALLDVAGPDPLPTGAPVNAVKGLAAMLQDPKFLGNEQVVDAAKPLTLQGADAAGVAVLSGTDPRLGPYRETLIIAIRNEDLYVLDLTVAADYAAQNQALLDETLRSFQFVQ